MNEQSGRIASLDGLRAVSIFLLLFSHMVGTAHFFVPPRVGHFFELGELGVRVFFVISGYLITSLLLAELKATERINLSRFYFRRTFRILIPYYALLLVIFLLEMSGWIDVSSGDMLHAVTYTSNYNPSRSWYVGHTWSLAVEEQFYLLWPAVLLALGKRKGLWVAFSLIILCPLIRIGLWQFLPETHHGIGHRFETVADSLAIGCVLAGAREWLHGQQLYRKLLGSRLMLLAPLMVLMGNRLYDQPRLHFLFGFTMMNIGIALSMDWCLTYSSGRVGRVLNSRILVFIGMMSYSIYLWQQLFLNRYSQSVTSQFPLNIILVATLSLMSYYIVERPSLKFRQRLETKIFPRRRPVVAADSAGTEVPHSQAARSAG